MLKPVTIVCVVISTLNLHLTPSFAKDKNPYKGTSSGPARNEGHGRALYTTEKKHPDKAERNAVFQDYGIPKDQWKNYVAVYRVPVSLGGSNIYSNIEALLKNQANIKSRIEKQLLTKLRSKEITLDEAQLRILNWQTDPLAAPQSQK